MGSDRIYTAGFGMADCDCGLPNTPDTRFLIGSLSKQFTAALILTLVRDGSVTLDAPRWRGILPTMQARR